MRIRTDCQTKSAFLLQNEDNIYYFIILRTFCMNTQNHNQFDKHIVPCYLDDRILKDF